MLIKTREGYTHNPYNGVVCNDIILATGVFSSKELWKLSKGIISKIKWEIFYRDRTFAIQNSK